MAFSSTVVPMPRWSAAAGCTKFGLAILILAFVAACTAIWGGYPAFSITLFTAVFSLVAFGYYLTALSLKTSIYNKRLILLLEALLTAFWLISLVLLACWTVDSANVPRFSNTPCSGEPTSEVDRVKITRRAVLIDREILWLSPLQIINRESAQMSGTPINTHGQNAQAVARALAGLSTGLAGLIFALYAATFITFALNFNKPAQIPPSSDEEAPPVTNNAADLPTAQSISPIISLTPALTQLVWVDTRPKDFEPRPQTGEHYLTPEQAANAGIKPPTPVLRAQQAEKEKDTAKDAISLHAMRATAPPYMGNER